MRLPLVALALLLSLPAAAAPEQRKKLAVLEFDRDDSATEVKDRTYFSDRVREAASRLLPQDRFFIMTRESTEELLRAQGKSLADCTGNCEVETGRLLSADLVLSGRLTKPGTQLKLSMRLHQTADGALLGSKTASGETVDKLDDALPAAVEELLRSVLGGTPQTSGGGNAVSTPTRGVLAVSTEPSGADVVADGLLRGPSPLSLELSPGAHVVEARKPGYAPASKTAQVRLGEFDRLSLTLQRLQGRVSVANNARKPATCKWEDGSFEVPANGVELVRLPTGRADLRCSADGYEDTSAPVQVDERELRSVRLDFKAAAEVSRPAPSSGRDDFAIGHALLPTGGGFETGLGETYAFTFATRLSFRLFGVMAMGELSLISSSGTEGAADYKEQVLALRAGVGIAPLKLSFFDPYALYKISVSGGPEKALVLGSRFHLGDGFSLALEYEKGLEKDDYEGGMILFGFGFN